MEKCLVKTSKLLLNRKSRGFSLIVVLIVSIIALAIMGASLNVSMNAAGAGRTNSARDAKYNILQDGVEQGKAALMRIAEAAPQVPKYIDKYGGAEPAEIVDLDTLLIENGEVLTETWTKSKLGRLGIIGDSATFKVRIYDMQYKPELIPSVASGKITPEEVESLPPAITASGKKFSSEAAALDPDDDGMIGGSGGNFADNAGVYLIRASLEIGMKDYSLDTAVIQSLKN
jgi:hypothetical protein